MVFFAVVYFLYNMNTKMKENEEEEEKQGGKLVYIFSPISSLLPVADQLTTPNRTPSGNWDVLLNGMDTQEEEDVDPRLAVLERQRAKRETEAGHEAEGHVNRAEVASTPLPKPKTFDTRPEQHQTPAPAVPESPAMDRHGRWGVTLYLVIIFFFFLFFSFVRAPCYLILILLPVSFCHRNYALTRVENTRG